MYNHKYFEVDLKATISINTIILLITIIKKSDKTKDTVLYSERKLYFINRPNGNMMQSSLTRDINFLDFVLSRELNKREEEKYFIPKEFVESFLLMEVKNFRYNLSSIQLKICY